MAYKSIMVSLNCTEKEQNVIHEAVRLARDMHSKVSAIHINDPAAGKSHMMMGGLPLKKECDIRNQFRKLGYQREAEEVNVIITESANYPKEIAKATKDIDLLVMGHQIKRNVVSALAGSVDERVSNMIKCPMLVVPILR